MGKYRMKGEEVRGLGVSEGKRVADLWEIQDERGRGKRTESK